MSPTSLRGATIPPTIQPGNGLAATANETMMRSEVWKIAIEALRVNKVKAFLTMLGVVIGSACIVLVVTISLIGKNYIIAQIEGVGSNIVYGELVRTGSQGTALSDEITLSDLESAHDTVPGVA